MQFEDQFSPQHLLEAMVSYLTSNTLRYANRNYDNFDSQQVSNFTNGSGCFATHTSPRFHIGDPAPCNKLVSQGSFSDPSGNYRRRPVLGRRAPGFRTRVPSRSIDALDISWE